jgi:2-iminobutanoate/2-iminopropanoate deaminase
MKRKLFALIFCALAGVAVGQAQTSGSAPRKQVILPKGYHSPAGIPLSPGILVGDTLYLSGSAGSDPKTGQRVEGGLEAEMPQLMSNAQAILKAAGMDLSNVVSVTTYLADMKDYDRYNQIYRQYFKTEALPARTTVAVKELALGYHIEMTMIAVRTTK